MDRSLQIVFEVDQFKLTRQAWLGNVSRRIIFHIVGYYRKHPVQSAEHTLKSGAQVALPWSPKLNKVVFHFFYIDDRIKVELGESVYVIPTDSSFHSDGTENRLVLGMYPCGGDGIHRLGKVLTTAFIQELYDDGKPRNVRIDRRKDSANDENRPYSTLLEKPPPNFRFRRLSKAVNWQRLRTTDIDRYAFPAKYHIHSSI